MDVLQLIKEDHRCLKELLVQLRRATNKSERNRLFNDLETKANLHLFLERDYLYPEVLGLFNDFEVFVNT